MSTFIAGHVYSLKEEYKDQFHGSEQLEELGIYEGDRFTINATDIDQYGNMLHNGTMIAERNQRHMFKDKGLQYEFVVGKTYRLKSKFQSQADSIADIFGLDVDTNEPLQFTVSSIDEGGVFGVVNIDGCAVDCCFAITTERHMYYENPEA